VSLRSRLFVGLAAAAIVFIVVSVAITRTTEAQLIAQIDDQLIAAAGRPIPIGFPRANGAVAAPTPPLGSGSDLGVANPSGVAEERLGPMFEGIVSPEGEITTVFASDSDGTALASPNVTLSDLEGLDPGEVFTVSSADGSVHYRAVAALNGGRWDVHALPTTDVDAAVNTLIRWEVVGLILVLAVLGAVAFWVNRLGLRPVKEMTEVASRIAGGTLNVRIADSPHPRTEAAALATALNTMLQRLETSTASQVASETRLRRFVADASHELRTPITTIRGYTELYRSGGLNASTDLDDAMRRMEQEAHRTGRLVEDMLTLAKLDEQRPLRHENLDLASIVNDTAQDARVTLTSRANSAVDGTDADDSNALGSDTDPGRDGTDDAGQGRLPGVERTVEVVGCARPVPVSGDPDALAQVLANVVGNAIVHTTGSILIGLDTADGMAVVTVTDEGPGMTSETAARVTERFFRADPSRARHAGGSGLGLSIVEGVITAHGGSVSIESSPAAGTTVTLRLPLAGESTR